MTQQDFRDSFVETVDRRISVFKKGGTQGMIFFISARLGLVVGGASLPALTVFASKAWTTGFAIAVAVFAALDTQFPWGKEWRHYRLFQADLERIRSDYHHDLAMPSGSRGDVEISTTVDAFEHFYQRATELLREERESFFKFRTAERKIESNED